ncbi:NTP transferase domain-containing protein [Leucobacter allii]|uniref:NTP transferase domain-containing protein n=1 Tax=Leucobacter allii TaxID=2932247 RepID=UPI001FD083AA|nr:DUF6457 domain-containing protein [Leucobacter allii]UOR02744.1 NTP transferase domain-containing protein [Leucobacter allii]
MSAASAVAAIVLAGGRGARLGGADKAGIELAGERLVDRVVAAVRGAAAGEPRIVVAGPARAAPAGCLVVREDPPFGGPLAALAAALPRVGDAAEALLLSCDLVRPADAVRVLLAEPLAAAEDARVLRDPEGRAQWLAGRYRVAALRAGVVALGGDVAGRPLRRALAGLAIRYVDAPAAIVADIDTPEDLAAARAALAPAVAATVPAPNRGAPMSAAQHLPPEALDAWLAAAASELGLPADAVRIGTVLDVARDVAHDVARPAAPLSTFLLGMAYGRVAASGDAADPAVLAELAKRLTSRAAAWKDAAG